MCLLFLRLVAAPLLRMLYELCAMGCGYFLCLGWCYGCGWPRHRCVVSCAVRTRCVTARGSVGVRQWLFFGDGTGIWLRQEGNLRDGPRARRQRLPAVAEACGVVLRARRHLADMDSLGMEQQQ